MALVRSPACIISLLSVLALACSSGGGESTDQTSEPSRCHHHCCQPTTCAQQGVTCGSIPDGCGGTLDCGPCPIDSGATRDTATEPMRDAASDGGSTLPAPWVESDVGAVGTPGSASFSGGTFTVSGAGADIYASADAFHYVFQPLNGDAEIVAQVSSLTNTSPWAKAGIMVRQSLDASAPFAMTALWPSSGAFFEWRSPSGAPTSNGVIASDSPPYWVKLVRQGNTFTGYASPDGASWANLGTTSVAMTDPVYVGLAVTSHADPTLATGVFTNVTLGGGTTTDAGMDAGGGGGDSGGSGGGDAGSFSGWLTTYWLPNGWVEPATELPWSRYSLVIHQGIPPNADGSLNMGASTFYMGAPAGFNYPDLVAAAHGAGKKVSWNLMYDCGGIINQATSPGTIATLVSNMVAFTQANGYDGVDLDWECNVSIPQYEDLIQRLRAAMPNALITMALAAIDQATVASASAPYIDQANLMCYDMVFGNSDVWYNDPVYSDTGPINVSGSCNPPPAGLSEDSCDLELARVTGQVINWNGTCTSPGVPLAKIGIGVPFYGYRYSGCTAVHQTGCSPSSFDFHDLVNDPSRWQSGTMSYDGVHKANYLSIPGLNEFDTYTGVEFMPDVAAWAKSKGVGGFFSYAAESEYLANQTGDARWPLTVALSQALGGP